MLRIPQVFSSPSRLQLNRGQLDAAKLCQRLLAKEPGPPRRSLLNYDPSHKMLPVLTESLLLKKPTNGVWEDQITVLTSPRRLSEVDTALQEAASGRAPGGLRIRLGSFDAFCDTQARYGDRVVLYGSDDVDKRLWHDLMRATIKFKTLAFTSGLDNKLAIDKYADWDIFHNHSALDELQDSETVLRFTTINVPSATTRSDEKPPRASPALLSPEVCSQIVKAWEKRPSMTNTVVFCFDLDHCEALRAAFGERGIEAFIFDSKIPPPQGILLACHDQWPSLKLTNRISSIIMASPWVVDNNEAAFFERLELSRSHFCHIIQVVDSSFPGLVSLHSLAKIDPNVPIEDESVDSIIDMTQENPSVPVTPWMTKVPVQSEKMTDILPTDVCDHVLKTWEQMSRQQTTIVYCGDLKECLALEKLFRAKSYETVIGYSSSFLENIGKVAPQIVFVPRDRWSLTWKRRDSLKCDCLIIVRPLTQATSYHLGRLRRANFRDCKVIQVVDPNEPNVMTLAGYDDGRLSPSQEATNRSPDFVKSDEELEMIMDRKSREYEERMAMRRNEENVVKLSTEKRQPVNTVLGAAVPEQKPREPSSSSTPVPLQESSDVLTEMPPPGHITDKHASRLVLSLKGNSKIRWWECGENTLVIDMLHAGHIVVTMHEKPDRSFTMSCYVHSAPLYVFSPSDVVTPVIRAPGLDPEQAKPLIMNRFLQQLARPGMPKAIAFFADWHRAGCTPHQAQALEKALIADPRVRFTRKGRYLKPEESADGVEVMPPHEMVEWVAREEGSLMLARLRYSPPSEPLLTSVFAQRITRRIQKGHSLWGLQRSTREAKREKRRLRKEGKKERKQARKTKALLKEEAKAEAIARAEEAKARGEERSKMRAMSAARSAEGAEASKASTQE